MIIEIDTKKLEKNFLSFDQFIILSLIYHKEWKTVEFFYERKEAILIRDSLIDTKFILDKSRNTKFKNTVLSISNVSKLLGVRSDNIDFSEWYFIYPTKFGSRTFRSKNLNTIGAKKHKKKYFDKIKTIEDHKLACAATKAFVDKKRHSGELQYLPAMETVLNNAKWEEWAVLLDNDSGTLFDNNMDEI